MAKHYDSIDEVIDFPAHEWDSTPSTQPITHRNTLKLTEDQMQKGICSDADCQWPIAGWCVGCRAKLCQDHLHEHKNLHARAVAHASLQRGKR